MGQRGKLEACIKLNENQKYKNMWDAARAALRGKFTATKAFIRKEDPKSLI